MILEKQLSLIIKWSATQKKVTQKRKTKVSDNQEASNINMRHTSKTFFLAVCADPILFGASS